MIAPLRATRPQILCQENHEQFLRMFPQIQYQARLAFRRLRHEHREELVQEVAANAYCAFLRLLRRGKPDIAFASPLANFAIRQVIAGRRIAAKSGMRDVSSAYARTAEGVIVERLDTFDHERGEWRATLVEDRRATPADIATARIDVAAWFRSLTLRNHRIAMALAMGETTGEVARRFGLSSARISQLRGMLKASWDAFQGGKATRSPDVVA